MGVPILFSFYCSRFEYCCSNGGGHCFGVNGICYLNGLGYFHVEVDFIECSSWTAQGCVVRNALWSQNHGTEKAN